MKTLHWCPDCEEWFDSETVCMATGTVSEPRVFGCTHDGTATGVTRLRAGWLECFVRCETCGDTLSDVLLVQHPIRPEGV